MYQSLASPRSAPTDESVDFSPELDGPSAATLTDQAVLLAAGTRVPAPLVGTCRLEIGGTTSAGLVRERNEDSFLIQHQAWFHLDRRREVALVVVADGMGGHGAGDAASRLVVSEVTRVLAPVLSTGLLGSVSEEPAPPLPEQIDAAIKAAHRAVLQQAQQEPACRGMGATAAVVLVWDGTAFIGHVGDCRVYHGHGDRLIQVTQDQTLVARMVELGKLTPTEARTHPQRNEVTHAIGRGVDLRPAAHQVKLDVGDWLVVACDGLQAHVDEHKLADTIALAGPSASGLAACLVDLANNGGGSDNCTVVAVRCF